MSRPTDNGGDALPPQNLPSLGKGVDVHRDKLKEVAKLLRSDLTAMQGHDSGTVNYLQAADHSPNPRGFVSEDALGAYPAAKGVAATCKNAYDTIGTTYSTFIDTYEKFVSALEQTAGNYDKADEASEAHAKRAGTPKAI